MRQQARPIAPNEGQKRADAQAEGRYAKWDAGQLGRACRASKCLVLDWLLPRTRCGAMATFDWKGRRVSGDGVLMRARKARVKNKWNDFKSRSQAQPEPQRHNVLCMAPVEAASLPP